MNRTGTERRVEARIAIDARARYRTRGMATFEPAQILNIARHGLLLAAGRALTAGTWIHIHMPSGPNQSEIHLRAQVVRIAPSSGWRRLAGRGGGLYGCRVTSLAAPAHGAPAPAAPTDSPAPRETAVEVVDLSTRVDVSRGNWVEQATRLVADPLTGRAAATRPTRENPPADATRAAVPGPALVCERAERRRGERRRQALAWIGLERRRRERRRG